MIEIVRAFGMRVNLARGPVLREEESEDLTTAPRRAAGSLPLDALHIAPPREHWTPLERPVPGTLVTGTLAPEHRARFLLRLPRDWNGRLVVAGAPGIVDETSYDLYLSDFLVSRGYAFAATDKGLRRAVLDGDMAVVAHTPEAGLRCWYGRLEELARLSAAACRRLRGKAPLRTYAAGLSNGGYLARRAAESDSGLFDGALDVSGVLWRADDNLLSQLPPALRAAAARPFDAAGLKAAGFPSPDERWNPVVAQYRAVYWESVLALFVGDLDPGYNGPLDRYDWRARPACVREAAACAANTGDLKVPLVSLAGTRDYLISCARHALAYRDLVAQRGKAALHQLVVIDGAAHVDTDCGAFPFIEPLMPHAHRAFEALVERVEGAAARPLSGPARRAPRASSARAGRRTG